MESLVRRGVRTTMAVAGPAALVVGLATPAFADPTTPRVSGLGSVPAASSAAADSSQSTPSSATDATTSDPAAASAAQAAEGAVVAVVRAARRAPAGAARIADAERGHRRRQLVLSAACAESTATAVLSAHRRHRGWISPIGPKPFTSGESMYRISGCAETRSGAEAKNFTA